MRSRRVGLVAVALTVLLVGQAFAVQRFGPLQVSGNLETQNLLRHPEPDKWLFVQQRNTLRLRFDLDVIKHREGTLGFTIPGVKDLSGFLLYRPVYDSIYDIKPGGRLELYPYRDEIRDGSLDQFTDDVRDAERVGNGGLNAFREFYIDLTLSHLPLSFRIGRQQIVWGETDNFRMLDRVNPLDITWHLQQESWDKLRIPLYMVKALYSIGTIGPFGETFFEGYWGLGDWVPAEKKFLPYPWSVPLPDPFINPATCTDPTNPFTCGHFRTAAGRFGREGDYDKDPIDNGQWGARFVFSTPQAVQIGLHYFYNRFAFDDGSQPAVLRAVDQRGPTGNPPLDNLIALGNGVLPAEVVYPYIHTIGLSANYSEDEYTQTVYRMETIYELDLPFGDRRKEQHITNPDCLSTPPGPTCALAPEVPSGLVGVTKRDMWKGMVGFDRPTWIRVLNPKTTFFITGQFFWHYIVDMPEARLPSGRTVNAFEGGLGATDKVRDWELLATLAATTFMGPGGTIVPLVFVAVDPVNQYSSEAGWRVDYFFTNQIIFTLFQNYFFVPGYGGEVAETWGIGGLNKQRDETGIRATYQF